MVWAALAVAPGYLARLVLSLLQTWVRHAHAARLLGSASPDAVQDCIRDDVFSGTVLPAACVLIFNFHVSHVFHVIFNFHVF